MHTNIIKIKPVISNRIHIRTYRIVQFGSIKMERSVTGGLTSEVLWREIMIINKMNTHINQHTLYILNINTMTRGYPVKRSHRSSSFCCPSRTLCSKRFYWVQCIQILNSCLCKLINLPLSSACYITFFTENERSAAHASIELNNFIKECSSTYITFVTLTPNLHYSKLIF